MYGHLEPHVPLELHGLRKETVLRDPFFRLDCYSTSDCPDRSPVLVVPPLSGHCSWLIRDVVASLAFEGPVCLLDWVNPRFVSEHAGPFGLEASFRAVEQCINASGPETAVIGICQGAVTVLMAAGRCAANQSSPTPRKLVLIGGPIDPFSSPRKDAYINPSTLRALVKMSLVAVPWPYPGRGRIVFPLALRALALAGYACFGVPVPGPFRDNFLRQFGASDPFIPFHEVYATLVDLHGAWLLETLEKVFADPPMEGLWREPWVASGALAGTDIVAIEGELDDIAPPGQTAAALTLCASSKAARENPVIPGAGHFDLFSGPLWQDRVAPIVRDALHS